MVTYIYYNVAIGRKFIQSDFLTQNSKSQNSKFFQLRDGSQSAARVVADLDQRLGVERQIDIYPRTEFDESEMLRDLPVLADAGISDDASRHRPGDLTHKDALPVVADHPYGAPLVLRAALGKICSEESPRVMLDIYHLAGRRKPVGMHIERRHEDRELECLRVKPFRLIDSLQSYHAPVDAAHHKIAAVAVKFAVWTSEEIEYKAIHHHADAREYCRDHPWRKEEPHRHIQRREHYEKHDQYIGAFVVYLHLLSTRSASVSASRDCFRGQI